MRIACPYGDTCGAALRVTVAPGRRAGWSAPEEPAEITGVTGSCSHVVAFNRGDLDDAPLWDALDRQAKERDG